MRKATCGLLLLSFLVMPGVGQDAPAPQNPLAAIYLSDSLRKADYDSYAEGLIALIQKDPGAPAARIALQRCMDLEAELADPFPLYEMLRDFARQEFRKCGPWSPEYADAYTRLARRYDKTNSWHAVSQKWRGITDAAFVGPFIDGAAPAHDDLFGPEVLLDFNAEYDGAWGRVKWQKIRHHDPIGGELDLYNQQRWTGYGYYVATQIVSPQERRALLLLEVSGPAKVWLNGLAEADLDSRGEDLPDTLPMDVQLKRGVNTLLVKVSTVSSVQIRLLGEDYQPLSGVETRSPKPDSPVQPVHQGKRLARQIRADRVDLFSGSDDALSLLAAAQNSSLYGLSDKAGAQRDAAFTADAGAMIRLEYLRTLEDNPLHSYSDKRRMVRSIADGLIAEEPAMVPALLKKAELLSDDERYRDAIALLDTALEHAGQKWRVYLARARIFSDARWPAEEEGAIKAALKDAPTALPVLKAVSDFYGTRGALNVEIEYDRKRLQLRPGDPDAHMSLANTLGRIGDTEGAVRHFQALSTSDPGNSFLIARLAEALAADGKLDAALEAYETLASRSSRPETELMLAARACLQLGHDDRGEAYLDRILKLDPGYHAARRQLQLMRSESEDFWSAYSVGWEEMLQHDVSPEQFPRADSALVLDEMIQYVYADGSSVSYVHQVRKILTQDGVDLRGKDQISGELITARTVQPDGTVLEPITQAGGRIEFPGLTIGALIDVAFLVRTDGGPRETLDGDTFFFMDQSLDEPFAISRWVLITPADMVLNEVYHNLERDDEGVTISRTTEGARVVRTWDVRNPRHQAFEPFMPAPAEIVPWVELVQPRDWRDKARMAAADGLRRIMRTPLIQQRALEFTRDTGSDVAKARAIYEWVNMTFTTGGDAWNPHQALKAQAGDREDLFVSLCESAGVDLGFAYVDAAPPYKRAPQERSSRPHWAYPHREDFEELFYVVESEGERVFISLDERMRPFGEISSRVFLAPAVLWIDGRYELTHLPGGDREKDRFENRVHIRLAADGSAKLDGSITVFGERSYALKEQMRSMPYDDLCTNLEGNLAQHYDGFEVSECLFPKIGDAGEPLVQEYTGTVRTMANALGDDLTLALPGEKLGRLMSALVSQRRRELDIVIDFDLVQTDEIRISPPEGYAFRGVPRDLLYPTAPLIYQLKFRMDNGDLVLERKLVLGPGRFGAHEYNALVEQVKQITQSEDSTLRLAKVP